MTIRAARPQDAAAICEIWNPVIRSTLITFNAVEKTEADITALIAEKGDGFLVWVDAKDAPQGFVFYGQFRGGVGYRHTVEHTIILGDAARGSGAGRALMTAIGAHAKAAGMHSMWGGISAANPGAVTFHERVGFTQIARLPQVGRKFDQWIDLILMQKML